MSDAMWKHIERDQQITEDWEHIAAGLLAENKRLRAALDEYERNGYLSPAGRAALGSESEEQR